jgi:hypothetical protein
VQDRYAGDIGDYIKLAILRHLAGGQGLGVAWWLFPDEKNGDGRHIRYLEHPEKWMEFDPTLFSGLRSMVRSEQRTVASLHKLFPVGTRFACDQIPCLVTPYSYRPLEREKWFQKVKADLEGCDIVFVDPDNGLEPRSFSLTRRRAGKSVQFRELVQLGEKGRTLIVYHHYFRQQHDQQIQVLASRLRREGFRGIDVLRWHRISPRAFFLLNALTAFGVGQKKLRLNGTAMSACSWTARTRSSNRDHDTRADALQGTFGDANPQNRRRAKMRFASSDRVRKSRTSQALLELVVEASTAHLQAPVKREGASVELIDVLGSATLLKRHLDERPFVFAATVQWKSDSLKSLIAG